MPAAERDAFLEEMLTRQVHAEVALHNGDVTPRLSTWSQHDPVTVAGAAVPFCSGWPEVRDTFDWVAGLYTSCDDYDFELLAADACGDLAYTVGIERYRASTSSGAVVDSPCGSPTSTGGAATWRIVHRHGDHLPADGRPSPPCPDAVGRTSSG